MLGVQALRDRAYRRLAAFKRSARVLIDFHGKHKRLCPICNQTGYFTALGDPVRFDALCMRCGSLERHRQHHLLMQKQRHWIDGASVFHVAAEACFVETYKQRCARYVAGDYMPRRNDELRIDIQKLDFADETFDTLICHQVLEHVENDHAAVAEIFRVLKKGGRAIISSPIITNWQSSYRVEGQFSSKERDLYFGQGDHLRYYGRDFFGLLSAVGFAVHEDVAHEPDVSRYGLVRGHIIVAAHKHAISRNA